MHFLVTGCSSGLGLSLARAIAALPEHRLTATSRIPASSPDAVKEMTSYPNASWEPLDVSSPDLEAQLSTIVKKHGPVDVLINNAGFSIGGVLENTLLDLIRDQYETNIFGAIRTMQAVIPHMRTNSNGVIVNISSATFWMPPPGVSVYASTKFALEGLSAALASELAPFGIRVLIAQPGGMQTAFAGPEKAGKQLVPLPDEYKGTPAEFVMKFVESEKGKDTDPKKAARAIVNEVLEPTVVGGNKLVRLQLGSEVTGALKGAVDAFTAEGEAVGRKAAACDI
jgi:NAD(P)-dependent dehydrogenase (short-subunit alcohol dehydrogenase family)